MTLLNSILSKYFYIILALLLISLSGLYTFNNDFKLGFHADESKKVRFILKNKQDFKHPMLILQTAKVANLFMGYKKKQDTAVLARYTTAFYATLSVFLVFLITYTISRSRLAGLLASLLYGVTPGLAIHAHYIKEDVALATFLLLTIYAILKKWQSKWNFIWIGLPFGLAMSSHYKSILFIFILFLLPVLFKKGETYLRSYSQVVAIIFFALLVFLSINYPIFIDFEQFKNGILFEAKHAVKGHRLRLPFNVYPFFHLRQSFMPSMGGLFAGIGIVALFFSVLRFLKISAALKLVTLSTLIYYLAVEMAPLKPAPDYFRYILPVIPGLAILLACYSAQSNKKMIRIGLQLFMILCVIQPLYLSVNIMNSVPNDPRYQVVERMKNINDKYILWGSYTNKPYNRNVLKLNDYDQKAYLVLSSFDYSRYVLGESLDGQPESISQYSRHYKRLLSLYEVETISSPFSYAFMGPTIKIIKLNEPRKPGKESI
ncbi:MAG: phospholipid carrier-dependent glycosyltransferase [Methyloprofundus sp.]|nr:phospholipid carrier-dependent glycosyltransferase [Methyloprofundus sp.]